MREKIINLVTYSDILGEPVALKINKETTAKTVFGGLLTITLGFGIVCMCIILSMDVVFHLNPAIAVESTILDIRPNITLSKESMAIAFGVTNEGTKIVDLSTYFKINAQLVHNFNSGDADLIETDLPIKNCDKDDFPHISDEVFEGISLDQHYCIENQNLTIFGFWNELEIQYLSIKMNYCINETETDRCADLTEIKQFLNENPYYFNIFFLNTAINPRNYSDPISFHMSTKYKAVRPESYKYLEIYVKQEDLKTDDSILYSFSDSFSENITISYDYQETDDSDLGETQTLAEFMIIPSERHTTYHRIYKKLSEVIADVGGLSSVFFFVLKLLALTYSSIRRDEEILNKIFDYHYEEKIEEQKLQINTRNNSIIKIPELEIKVKPKIENAMLNYNNFFQTDNMTDRNTARELEVDNLKSNPRSQEVSIHSINSPKNKDNSPDNFRIISQRQSQISFNEHLKMYDVSTVKTKRPLQRKKTFIEFDNEEKKTEAIKKMLFNKEQYKLQFSFWEITKFFSCRCCVDKKTLNKFKLLNQSESVLDDYLDISYIVYKLEELEKLKLIFLTQEQVALFNFISKDVCSLDMEKIKTSQINTMKEFNRDNENLAGIIIKFADQINKGGNTSFITEIDKKLIDLLHEGVKNVLIENQPDDM